MSFGSFNVKDIVDDAINGVKNEITSGITSQINNATNQLQNTIGSQIMSTMKQIESTFNDLIVNKFVSVFSQIGDILKNGIVDPILGLFMGISNIFVQIFNIIKLIVSKITSLPSCMPFYMIDSFFSFIIGTIKYFVPGFIFDFFNNIYQWTFGLVVNWFLNVIGWTDTANKCNAFNVDEEVSQMNQELQNIGNNFISGFGNINFNTIKI